MTIRNKEWERLSLATWICRNICTNNKKRKLFDTRVLSVGKMIIFCGMCPHISDSSMSPRVPPSWEARDNTCGSLGRSRRRTTADHRSHWCHTSCRSCTRCTARDTSSHWSSCSWWTGGRWGDLEKWYFNNQNIIFIATTWSSTLWASNQLLGLICFLVVARVSETKVTVSWWLTPATWFLWSRHSDTNTNC